MTRITISLPPEEAEAVARAARRHGLSVSAYVRQTLGRTLAPAGDSAPPFAALGRSGARGTGRDAEQILAREWGGDRDR